VRGCSEGHCFCKPCYDKALDQKKSCPACRENVEDGSKLVPNRELAGVVANLRMRCPHAEGGKEDAASTAAKCSVDAVVRLNEPDTYDGAPAAFVTMEALRKLLREHFLDTAGSKAEMEARVEEDRKKRAGCGWKGRVAELPAHLGTCEWAPVECPNHCEELVQRRLLVEHERVCTTKAECPNAGCSVQHRRQAMNQHRAECEHEEVTCPCPGCDARLLREDLDAHVEAMHWGDWAGQLQRVWRENTELKEKAEIEHIHAAPTSWVFNWRADGWVRGEFESETHDFGQGVTGKCCLSIMNEHTHLIMFCFDGRAKCRVHATFSILDKHNKTLRQVYEFGTADAPEIAEDFDPGDDFTPTADDKAQSVRADGSIRLRAVVRLFLDGAA